ncbi:unnamed protein product [Cladocopium goreaui]|uniref:Nuclear migration protein nudC n=1 Tax=Cladocopium goreaui TaxID=2562237 RepID=A0A9P1DUJ1_9DINO|nr:unnamed protein product [Cladocopium goreaui]
MDGRFDDLLLGLAQKHKGIEDLLHTLMTFLERQSDLFHVKESDGDAKGFKEGEAEKMLRKQFSEFQARYLARAQPHLLAHVPQHLGGYAAAAASSSGKRSEVPMGINASPLEGGDPGQWESQKNKGEGWVWNQTPQEINVEIAVEPCRASDLKVAIAAKSLSIKLKGNTLLEGKLFDKINSEESTWHLDNGKQVVLNLEKIRPAFWEGLFEAS